jgi:hypothetical protein
MNKNPIYIFILAACSIFWIFNCKQFFVETYMRYTLRKSDIVITLSTTPYRIDKIAKIIDSLVEQNAPIRAIYISVPYVYKKNNLPYHIPEWLAKNKHITILRSEDYGPATKLLGLLQLVPLPKDTIVVTVDDDLEYPKNTILHLAYYANKYPQQAIGISGADIYGEHEEIASLDRSLGLKTRYNYDGSVTILQGYAGIAYRSNFFDPNIFDIQNYPTSCIYSDDLYFSFYLAKNNIPRRSIANSYISTSKIPCETTLATNPDALQKQIPSPPQKHQQCLIYLHDNFPKVNFN